MKAFKVVFVDSSGVKTTKQFTASDELEVYQQLEELDATPISVKEAQKSVLDTIRGDRITPNMIELVITNLASLLSSGISLDKALTLVAKSSETASLSQLVSQIQNGIRGGKSFADSLSQFPEYFDELVINLVQIGESTGQLDKVLIDLSGQLKFQSRINSQIKQAAIYPLVIVFVCILSILFILYSVVPQLSGMLEQVKDLPGYTIALMATSDFVRSTPGTFTLIAIAVSLFYFIFTDSTSIKESRQKIKLVLQKAPLVRGMVALSQQLRFASAMKSTLNSGLSITDALNLSANTLTDTGAQLKFLEVKSKIQSGVSLTKSMEDTGLFTVMETGFIEVGEETGDLAKAFSEMLERKSHEFDTKLASTLKMLEPLLILFMGVIVGGVVIIMMLSIMSAQNVGI
ncbi:type II secretion system F family protein [Pseudoalteromonas sp. SSM20]|uniref:type II secretion system F family protein n=1 Tax=Pseudoalteromonas sp. SSM20 TaxID=3139394 RepID=UPI003BA95626